MSVYQYQIQTKMKTKLSHDEVPYVKKKLYQTYTCENKALKIKWNGITRKTKAI